MLKKNGELLLLMAAGLGATAAAWLKNRSFMRPWLLLSAALPLMILLHIHYAFSPLYWLYRYAA